jgi:hypothetical protein
MPPDPATDSAGRLGKFLNKAIGDLTKPQEAKPMATALPIIPVSAPPAKKDDLVTSLTGALGVADALMQRIAKSKARHVAAGQKVADAFVKLDGASEVLEMVADKADAEADAVLAKLGQVSNLGA